MYGRHMIVHGGINAAGEFLNDWWELNIKTRIWTQLVVGKPNKSIAFHTMVSVFNSHRKPHSITLYRSLQRIANNSLENSEGIYVFGG